MSLEVNHEFWPRSSGGKYQTPKQGTESNCVFSKGEAETGFMTLRLLTSFGEQRC